MLHNNTALIILDLENDLIHPEGKLALSVKMVVENDVIAKTNAAIQRARQWDALVIFVRVGFSRNYVECPTTSPLFSYVQQAKALQLNTWGTEFDKNLDVREEDIVITKHRVSAFYATSLQAILTARQIQQLFFAVFQLILPFKLPPAKLMIEIIESALCRMPVLVILWRNIIIPFNCLKNSAHL